MKKAHASNSSAEGEEEELEESKPSDVKPTNNSTSTNPWFVQALFEGIQSGTSAYLQSPAQSQHPTQKGSRSER